MTKNLFIFAAAFIGGTVIALAVRAALHDPYSEDAPHAAAHSPAPMVDNSAPAPAPVQPPAADTHAGHTAPQELEEGQPVNTICPICGMEVDPSVPTASYQGKTVGFGCRACPPRFAREPDKYGPAALRNVVVED